MDKIAHIFLAVAIIFLVVCVSIRFKNNIPFIENSEKKISAVYNNYRTALKDGDLNALKQCLSEKAAQDMNGPQAEQAIEILRGFASSNFETTGITVTNNTAIMNMKLTDTSGMTGTVTFVREDKKWKVLKEDWTMVISSDDGGFAHGGEPLFFSNRKNKPECKHVFKGHTDEVTRIAFSSDGKNLFSASYGDFTLRRWDVYAGTEEAVCKFESRPTDIVITPDGKTLIITDACKVGTVMPIDFDAESKPLDVRGGTGRDLCLSYDGVLAATTAYKQSPIQIWNIPAKKLLKSLDKTEDQRTCMFTHSGEFLVSVGINPVYTVWDTSNWKPKQYKVSKVSDDSETWRIDISKNDALLATAHQDSSIAIHDFVKRKELHNFFVKDCSTFDVKFSFDASLLATANGNTVFIWDVKTGEPLARLEGHTDTVLCLAFSPDGSRLASGSKDGTILIWQ